jgi:hypothetical protein
MPCKSLLTSGPFGVSMSAAARPKRWGVFRQAKGREFDRTRVEVFTLLTRQGVLLRVPRVTWGGKRNDTHKWIASDGSELFPTTDVEKDLTLRLPHLYHETRRETLSFSAVKCDQT